MDLDAGTTLAARLRRARVDRGLSQTDLAAALNVNRSTVGHWEREHGFSPSIAHLQRLSEVMNISLSWLAQGRGIEARAAAGGARASLESRMIASSRNLPVSVVASVVALMESAEVHL
ncbi:MULTISPECIES: helix-turn-helix transcriptional regulator [Stenotrophomonas]|uniref:helix-turn-helix transcriptional regulator n=1 Tax=Stenotrophomonas TaxID=40323 RepID=UPI002168A211|nr:MULTISPECIES: helix-turn-helix transcriptional regulator [Stenotrophomonas]